MLDIFVVSLAQVLAWIFIVWLVLFLLGLKLSAARVAANLYRRALWALTRSLCRWLRSPPYRRRGVGHHVEDRHTEGS